jgi:hypothetical protein
MTAVLQSLMLLDIYALLPIIAIVSLPSAFKALFTAKPPKCWSGHGEAAEGLPYSSLLVRGLHLRQSNPQPFVFHLNSLTKGCALKNFMWFCTRNSNSMVISVTASIGQSAPRGFQTRSSRRYEDLPGLCQSRNLDG